MAKQIDETVKEGEEALAKLSASSVESIVAQESNIEEQKKALQEKIDALETKEKAFEAEKKSVDAEMQKIPPFLAKKLLDLQIIDDEIRASRTKRDEAARNLKGDLVKADLKEDFVNKVLGLKGIGPKSGSGKKGELEPHILEILGDNPGGMTKKSLVVAVETKFGHNKGSISRVLADQSEYVAGGTLIQRGIVTKDGDKLVKA